VLQHAEQLRDFHGVGLPFVFYTNGHKHFFWESDFYSPEKIVGFPTRDDLECVKLRWRIAAILDKADAVRRKRQQTLDLADQFLRSAFLDMFGDPVTNPKGWEKQPLAKICEKITDGVHKTPKYVIGGVPFVSTVHLNKDGINWDSTKFITEVEHAALIKRCQPEVGDVLYTKVGSVGLAVPVIDPRPFSIFVQLALLKLPSKKVDFLYVATHLNLPQFRAAVVSRLTGATMKYIGIGDIGRLQIMVPPLREQQRFARIYDQAKCLRFKSEEKSREENALFNSLVQRAFRGELP